MNESADNKISKIGILRARAAELAREPAAPLARGGMIEIIEFALADERYAFDAVEVREVYPLEDLTPVPCTPPFVLGLANVRGLIFPVIDLRKFFDLPEPGICDLHRILIVHSTELEFGILADTILGGRFIPIDSIQPSLPTLTGIRAEYLKGVTADRIIILNAAAILADRRLVVNDEVAA